MGEVKLGEMKILSLSFNDEENVFTVGSTDGFAVYDCYPLAERFKRTTFGKGIKIVEILGKSNILALVGGGENPAFPPNKVILWNDETCECIAEIEVDSQTAILGVKLQLDKIYVIQEEQVLVFDTRNLNLIQTIQTSKNINGLCIARNNVMATLGKKIGEIVIYRDGKERVIKPHSDYVVRISFNKDASLIASASKNGRNIYVCDTKTGVQKFQFRRGSEEVDIYSISFSSQDSKLLCVNSDKGTSHIWKLEEGKGTTSMLSGLTGWGASLLPKVVDDHLKNVWSDIKFAFPTDEPIFHCFVNDKQKDVIVCICLRGDYFCYSMNTSSDGSGSVTQTVYSSFGYKYEANYRHSITFLAMEFASPQFYSKPNETIQIAQRKVDSPINSQQKKQSSTAGPGGCMLEILDTAGTEQFTAMRDLYMKNGDAFLIVFSLVAQSTFNDAQGMREMIQRVRDEDFPAVVLVGNKVDLEDQRVIPTSRGQELANEWNCPYFETSAKTNYNITEAMHQLVREASAKKPGERSFKIVVMGAGGVGKSATTVQFVQGVFVEKYDPTIEDSYRKHCEVSGLFEPVKQSKSGSGTGSGIFSRVFGLGKSKKKEGKETKEEEEEEEDGPKVSVQKVIPNQVRIRLGKQLELERLQTGEAILCTGCSCCFSELSNYSTDDKSWKCEFCGKVNEQIYLDAEEIPTNSKEGLEYVLEFPEKAESNEDEQLITICLDLSGSMCVSNEIPSLQSAWRSVRQKYGDKEELMNESSQYSNAQKDKKMLEEALGDAIDMESQWMDGEEGNQYITRLECMQAAIVEHLSQLKVLHPNHKVILVTFSDEVTVYQPMVNPNSDKVTVDTVTIVGDKLNDKNQIASIADEIYTSNYGKISGIETSYNEIVSIVKRFAEKGPTALGPALLFSQELCKNAGKSEIIICTDGLSNVGVGSLENNKSADKFYEEIGKSARKSNCVISIMSIEGSDCNMKSLGKCAEITGGRVNILNPFELVAEIQRIAQNPVVATDVQVKIFCKPKFSVDFFEWNSEHSVWLKQIGNVMKATDLTFCLTPLKDSTPSQDVFIQVQVLFTKTDFSKRLLVYSSKTSSSDTVADDQVDISVVAQNSIQSAALLSQNGEFEKALHLLVSTNEFLKKVATSDSQKEEYAAFLDPTSDLEREIRKCISSKGRTKSDEHTKVLLNAKVISSDTFLSGRRKDVSKREKGVFSNEKLRDAYYVKRF